MASLAFLSVPQTNIERQTDRDAVLRETSMGFHVTVAGHGDSALERQKNCVAGAGLRA